MRPSRTFARAVAAVVAVGVGASLFSPALAASRPRKLVGTRAGEFQPARGRDYIAWERNTPSAPGRFHVYARRRGGKAFRVNAPGSEAANGGISGRQLVYQEWRGRRSNIKVFNLRKRGRARPLKAVNTRHWEYWPSVSGRWLLFGRRKRDGSRRILLFDRKTGRHRILARTPARASFAAPVR